MKIRIPAVLVLVLTVSLSYALRAQKTLDREKYYSIIQQEELQPIDDQLEALNTFSFKGKSAFVGALMMKKAGVIKGASKKLKLFKNGSNQLEAAITKDPENAEYRFLRLIIQEHAPGIVNYHNDKTQDKEMIVSSYKKFPSELQKAVSNYSSNSKTLDPKDF
ncbi:MAG TPA: hypothetical protein VK628_08135 [Flavitalea sp.]|nr:hypothetical protein [Flavitalea sp.]